MEAAIQKDYTERTVNETFEKLLNLAR